MANSPFKETSAFHQEPPSEPPPRSPDSGDSATPPAHKEAARRYSLAIEDIEDAYYRVGQALSSLPMGSESFETRRELEEIQAILYRNLR